MLMRVNFFVVLKKLFMKRFVSHLFKRASVFTVNRTCHYNCCFAFQKTLTFVDMLTLFCAVAALIIFLLLCILSIVFPYDYSWKLRRSDTKKIEMIPGPKTMPFFGNILMFNVPPDRTYKLGVLSL
jgi:hypothetical protein